MVTPEQKLKRFLHYGRDVALYQPGNRFHNAIYHPLELLPVEALIASDKATDAVNCIVKAFTDGYSPHPEMLVYALAVCAKQKTSEQLRENAYKAVRTLCASTEDLFLFIKFAIHLSPSKSIWGAGCRKAVTEWYLSKDAKTLAAVVSRNKRSHGWSHKDVMKLIHLKTENPAKAAVVNYVLFGIKTAKEKFSDQPEAADVLSYLQTIEDFYHVTDEQQAAALIDQHKLSLQQVPAPLIKSKEVWAALISTMPLDVLIKNLERIGYMGFLKQGSPLVAKVIDALGNEQAIADAHLNPATVFVALRNYEMSSQYVAAEAAQKKRKTENGTSFRCRSFRVHHEANTKVVAAMHELFSATLRVSLSPTGVRYHVTVDVMAHGLSDKCCRCPHVSTLQATAVTLLCLLQADRRVKMHTVGLKGTLQPFTIEPTMTVQQTVDKLTEIQMRRLTMPMPINSALQKLEEHDVFILITDGVLRGSNRALSVLGQYRTQLKLPNAKLITLLLKGHTQPVWTANTDDPGMFDITGFDGFVPRIIEGFSRGAF